MENMESKILEVLQDPQQMDQILQFAKNLGFGPPDDTTKQESTMPDPSILAELQKASCDQESRRDALIQALLPYLKPEKQKKLQRAVKLAKLSNFAGVALQNFTE